MARGKGESEASLRRIAAKERARQALELRKAGAGYVSIANALGYASASGAHAAVKRALRWTLQEPADELRQIEQERLDALLLAVWPQAKAGHQGAVDRALRIMERRAKLLGLDAATKHEVEGLVKNVDLSALSDHQLSRLAAGEDVFGVLTTPGGG